MTDEADLLILADKCRSLATLTTDESTVGSLNRLADGYETQAKVNQYLAHGFWSMDQAADGSAPPRAHH
jgi:hypothetical protein